MSFPAKDNTTQTNLAKKNDLERVRLTINNGSFPDLSNKSRSLLSLMISLVKLGYTGISAPIDALETTLSRVGYSISRRSIFRGLSELESHGYFHRKKYRVGNDKFGTELVFIPDRFEFWKKSTSKPITSVSIPTNTHSYPQVPNWQEDSRTKIHTGVNSSYINKNCYKKPRGRAGVNKIHPVLYTLSVVLTKSKAKDRGIVLSRARCEIEAEKAGFEAAGHSGAHWDRPSWSSMPNDVKESICRAEILPLLRNLDTLKQRGETVEFFEAIRLNPEMDIPVQTQEIQPRGDRPAVDLSRDDLAILEAAALRARRRVC